VCDMQMLFQSCEVFYNSCSLWTDDTVSFLHMQSPALSSSDSTLQLVLVVIDCMISVSLNQVHCHTLSTI